MALLELRNVGKRYENSGVVTQALIGIDLKIEKGEFIALMGPSGSGKSTLMHILGFLDRLTEGEYFFNGRDASKLSNDELAHLRRDQVGFIFQFFNLLADCTVLENVVLPLVYSEISSIERYKRARAAIEAVGITPRVDYLASRLSGGERQRVAIARAIVNNPAVIFADEPTGNLDTKTGAMVLNFLQELNQKGHTVVMVTHEQEAAEFASRIIRIRDGQIISDNKDHHVRRGNFYK
ncbi:MAG: ABC transporter ATP-binding protein [Patescibacteria group bacterium]|jgi:putative ABC transport system ATP-binding protein